MHTVLHCEKSQLAVSHSLIALIVGSGHITSCKITACHISLLNRVDPKLPTYNLMENQSLLYLTP